MGKKKRLPPGGKKLNYTLYMSPDDKEKISARAEELEWAESYYVVTLCDIDSQLGLAEHLMSGGLIQLVPKGQEPVDVSKPVEVEAGVIPPGQMPVPPDVTELEKKLIEQDFKDNLAKSREQTKPLSREEYNPSPVSQQPIHPPPQRPPMVSIQDLVQQSISSPLGEVAGMPTLPNMEKAHQEVRKDQSGASETAMRKQILDNLPPVEKEE